MSTYSNPFETLEEVFERLSRQFDEAARAWESGEAFEAWRFDGSMAVDLADRDDEFVVTVDVPGFDRDEIDIRMSGRTLHIEAEHAESIEEREENYLRKEREHRSTTRSIQLPADVPAEDVSATLKRGVLTITLPKAEPTESGERIEIN